ncbi:acyl--CoA ligase [Sulfitobacter sp. 1151]|uniref:Acyl--CoA ligase n=2 Tax=Parasulfitobacter algicola TaxID=2614809 RepID=A0ABX2ISN0_9RHOB|nr:class I adenylate-forming enzyme family protein [Sulfitobacter algicola]NSX55001.1 acyl--CoA ligase [Sulfitobacter algicola]
MICDYLDDTVLRWPDTLAILDSDGRRWTYSDLQTAVTMAAKLLTENGVTRGDRVLIVAENCAETVAFLFASIRAGAWAVPVNARQTPSEIARILDHATPRAVVLTVSISSDAAKHAENLQAEPQEGAFGKIAIATPYSSAPDPDHDVAVMLYTTGTTGQPKGVMLTHGNLRFGGHASATIRGITKGDVVYGVLPMTHVFGLASMVMASVYAGATIQLDPRFSAEKLYKALRSGVTILPAVPQMHALLMQYTQENNLGALVGSGLRYVSSGAAPLDPIWKKKAEAFYGIALQNGYGMTETTAGVATTCNAMGSPDTSVGQPLAGVDVRIDQTIEGGGDGLGEVLTRGPHIMRGYYKNPDETARVLDAHGWLRTGDLGKLDDQGRLHILGRSKELIIRGGFNVYPPEVEAALNDHPGVVQSAVIGRTLADGDEQVLAFVQCNVADALIAETLKAFVAGKLAPYKRPSQIIIAKSLPAAPTGKILKHKLLEHFAKDLC